MRTFRYAFGKKNMKQHFAICLIVDRHLIGVVGAFLFRVQDPYTLVDPSGDSVDRHTESFGWHRECEGESKEPCPCLLNMKGVAKKWIRVDPMLKIEDQNYDFQSGNKDAGCKTCPG